MDVIIFSKIRDFFQFSKKCRGDLPLPLSCAPVSVAENASISLNIPKFPRND